MRIKRLSVDDSDETLGTEPVEEPEIGAAVDATAVVAPEPDGSPADTDGTPDPDYTEERWGAYTNYRCVYCPYSTLSRDAIEAHVAVHRTVRDVAQWRVE